MQIISTMALHHHQVPVPVITYIKNNFTFCPGKSRENFPNIFQDFPGLTNKIQGLSRTAKKSRIFQDVATLDKRQISATQNSHWYLILLFGK